MSWYSGSVWPCNKRCEYWLQRLRHSWRNGGNVPKPWTFLNWFGKSHVTHKNKPSRTISTRNSRSMRSALSRKRRSKNQATSRFPRSSTRSRSCSASFASIIVIQELYTVYVDVWWRRTQVSIESIYHLLSTHSPSRTFTTEKTDHVVTGMAKLPDAKNTTRHINLQKKCRKKGYDSIYDRYIRDKLFRSAMIEHSRTEQVILEMDKLANENHSFKVSKNEIEFYRGNWWLHSNVARAETMPVRHEPGFKEALSTMQRLKRAEDKKKQVSNGTTFFILVFMALAVQLVGVRLRAIASKMVWHPYEKWCITYWGAKSRRTERIWIFFLWLSYNR